MTRTKKRPLQSLGNQLRARNKMSGPALLPSFSRVSRGFEDHVSELANAQLDAASWDGRGGCEADGVVTCAPPAPTTPPTNPSPPPLSRAERGGSRCARGGRSRFQAFLAWMARRRAEEGPLWGSDPGGAHRAGCDALMAGSTVASPQAGPLLNVPPAPRSGMQRRDCPRAYVRLHGRIPMNGAPAQRFGAPSPARGRGMGWGLAGTPSGQPHGGGWRSVARRCAGTFFEIPPHPRAGGEFILLPALSISVCFRG